MTSVRVWVAVLLMWHGAALAQGLEIITLHHRTAEQVMPNLRPLLAPGATLSGQGNKLFVRTTPANRAELRQVLDVLDRPLRQLVISVRHADRQAAQGGQASVGGEIGRRTLIYGGIAESRMAGREDVAQRVRTVEGGRAFINVGQSMPMTTRQVVQTPRGPVVTETTTHRETGTGFHVEPSLAGDQVTLAIMTANDAPGAQPGSVEIRRVVSTVSGRLGEWIPLAGATRQAVQGGYQFDDRQVWLMVEEVP